MTAVSSVSIIPVAFVLQPPRRSPVKMIAIHRCIERIHSLHVERDRY
jgi:hypothetical protein